MLSRNMRALALAAGILAAGAAHAERITFGFAGTVNFVNAGVAATIPVGSAFSGAYSFDSTLTDGAAGDSGFGVYGTQALTLTLDIAGLHYTQSLNPALPAFSHFEIADGAQFAGGPPGDGYSVWMNNLSGDSIGTFAPISWNIQMRSPDTAALGSDALPLVPPHLGLFDLRATFLTFQGPGGLASVRGELSELYLVSTPVPEPESYALLLAGLGLLGYATRRRRRASPSIPNPASRRA